MSGPPERPAEELLAAGPARRRAAPGPPRPFLPLPEPLGRGTVAVHAGRAPERNAGAVVTPIYQTSTFRFPGPFSEVADPGDVHVYTADANPTAAAAAEAIRALEGAEAARVFASGMAAVAATVLTFARPGAAVVASEEVYGGTRRLLGELFPRIGLPVRWVPAGAAGPEEALAGGAALVFLETPSNPALHVRDLARWAAAADAAGALFVVDNTFATPINQRPIAHGADLVVHSASKYLGGHSDVIAGAVAGPSPLLARVARVQRVLGGSLDPFAAFLLHRGLKTLGVRVARHNENGRTVAERLAAHPAVTRVHYPGRAGPEEEAIARRQMDGRGGMVAFELAGGGPAAERFLHRLRLVEVASSLGGVESLVSRPSETSHVGLAPEESERLGIRAGLVRLSCGIEEPEDLWGDLRQALEG